jgi:hypothetical protein
MNDKLERIWKGAVVVLPRHLPGETEENTRNLRQDSQCLQDLFMVMLTWTLCCSVDVCVRHILVYMEFRSSCRIQNLLKSSVAWDMTPCSPLKLSLFYLPPAFMLVSCSAYSYPKRRLVFNGLHGVISQKIELFITIPY